MSGLTKVHSLWTEIQSKEKWPHTHRQHLKYCPNLHPGKY